MMKKDAAENVKLYMAAIESYRTGSITPILKEELKYSIQSRRLSEGKDEMVVEFEQVKKRKLVRKLFSHLFTYLLFFSCMYLMIFVNKMNFSSIHVDLYILI